MKKEIKEFLEDEENIEILKELIENYKKERRSKFELAMREIKTNKIKLVQSFCVSSKYVAGKLTVIKDFVYFTSIYGAHLEEYYFNKKQSKELFEICENFYLAEKNK